MKTALLSFLLFTMSTSFQSADTRKVLLFSTHQNGEDFVQQQKVLSGVIDGLHERAIEIHTYTLGKNKAEFSQYKIGDHPFTFILIGKDGGEKLRSHGVVTPEKLFGLIDQMPMRRREMGH